MKDVIQEKIIRTDERLQLTSESSRYKTKGRVSKSSLWVQLEINLYMKAFCL